jgi:hypothetical protein
LHELPRAEAAGHRLRYVVAVPPADFALGACAGLGEADAARPSVVGIIEARATAGGWRISATSLCRVSHT